jgi:hypothetical protein
MVFWLGVLAVSVMVIVSAISIFGVGHVLGVLSGIVGFAIAAINCPKFFEWWNRKEREWDRRSEEKSCR